MQLELCATLELFCSYHASVKEEGAEPVWVGLDGEGKRGAHSICLPGPPPPGLPTLSQPCPASSPLFQPAFSSLPTLLQFSLSRPNPQLPFLPLHLLHPFSLSIPSFCSYESSLPTCQFPPSTAKSAKIRHKGEQGDSRVLHMGPEVKAYVCWGEGEEPENRKGTLNAP